MHSLKCIYRLFSLFLFFVLFYVLVFCVLFDKLSNCFGQTNVV